jgi:hypothetical protein
MPLIVAPRLIRFTEGWRIGSAAKSGGATLAGQERFVVSPAARWEAKLSFHCVEEADYLEADGFLASLDGPANPFLCGPIDWRGRPWNTHFLTGAPITPRDVARDIKDNPAFETELSTTGSLDFLLAAPVAMNGTQALIQRNRGGLQRRGQYFSIGNNLHIITEVLSPDVTDPATTLAAPGQVLVNFRPWARADYAVNSPVEFANPVATMRLSAQSSAMVERNTTPVSDLALDLIEYF